MNRGTLLLLFLHVCILPLKAALTLEFNTSAETFSLKGSDTGTPYTHNATQYEITWLADFIGGTGDGFTSSTNTNFYSLSSGEPGLNSGSDVLDLFSASDEGGHVTFTLYLRNITAPLTVTGNEAVANSYAAIPGDAMDRILGFAGSAIPLYLGTDYADLNITVVPEPRTTTVLMGLIVLAGLFYRKNSRRA